MCGEKSIVIKFNYVEKGSPPRVRGKVYPAVYAHFPRGITPACAGKSHPEKDGLLSCWDHPRVCGEKRPRKSWRSISKGSPPRVRGKEGQTSKTAFRYGITPACAGKRSGVRWYMNISKDHPRVCGEKQDRFSRRGGLKGSPPRVRGKAVRYGDSRKRQGITPACAGKRVHIILTGTDVKDHPRVCGEKTKKIP